MNLNVDLKVFLGRKIQS